MKANQKVAVGALAGAAVGFVAGILFAPKSGKETRADIKRVAVQAAKKVQADADAVLAEAKKLQEKLSGSAKKELQKLRDLVEQKTSTLKSKAAAAKNDEDLKAALNDANDAIMHLKKFIANVKTDKPE